MVIIIIYLSYKKYIERFTDNTDNITAAINDTFKADLSSIINLGTVLDNLNTSTSGDTADLSHINNTKINDLIVNNMSCDNLFIDGNIEITGINDINKLFNIYPRYMIMIWTQKNIPKGWAVCNGATWYVNYETGLFSINTNDVNNYTAVVVPDLRDRFVIGATHDNIDHTYSLNNTGGQNSTILNNFNIPPHKHTTPFLIHNGKIPTNAQSVYFLGGYYKGSSYVSTPHHKGDVTDLYPNYTGTSYGHIVYVDEGPLRSNFNLGYPIYTDYTRDPDPHNTYYTTDAAGKKTYTTPSDKSAPHENRPPYYKLYYIMKL